MKIGILINTNSNQKQLCDIVKTTNVVDNKCCHYESTFEKYLYCPICGQSFTRIVEQEQKVYGHSGFSHDFTANSRRGIIFTFNQVKYVVEADMCYLNDANRVLIVIANVKDIQNDQETPQDVVQLLNLGENISNELKAAGFTCVSGITNFLDWFER